MTLIHAYLHFNGQCREAMNFYQQCLGGELTLQKVGESPMAAQLPSEMSAHILHGQLLKENLVLLASDMCSISFPRNNNSSVALCLQCSELAEAYAYFEKLAEGGTVKTPLHQTFWGATYGELTDKFGTHWLLNCSRN